MRRPLSPVQQDASAALSTMFPRGHLFVLHGQAGAGKSTVLQALHDTMGGTVVPMGSGRCWAR